MERAARRGPTAGAHARGVAARARRVGVARPAHAARRDPGDRRSARRRRRRRSRHDRPLPPTAPRGGRPPQRARRRPLRAEPDAGRRAPAPVRAASRSRDLVSDALAGSAPVAARRASGSRVGWSARRPSSRPSAPEVLRVLRNLLENAIRHTPSDGSVVVEAGIDERRPAASTSTVRDTGGGVPEPTCPHLRRRVPVATALARRVTAPGSGSRSPRASSRRTTASSPSATRTAAPASRSSRWLGTGLRRRASEVEAC